MKDLKDYLHEVFEEVGDVMATPANTMGAGEPSFDTDGFISAPIGGTPKQTTRITKRRKKSKKGLRDYLMTGKVHNV